MTRNAMTKAQTYCRALRQELGYPPFAPVNDTVAVMAGGLPDAELLSDLKQHAITVNRDLIHAAWPQPSAAEPDSLTLVIRKLDHADVLTGCRLWAKDEASPVIIVVPGRNEHYAVDWRGNLERRRFLPFSHIGHGRRIARRRVLRADRAMTPALVIADQRIAPASYVIAPEPAGAAVLMRAA